MINVERSAVLTPGGDTEADASDIKTAPDPVTTPLDPSKGYSDERIFREEEQSRKLAEAKKHELSTAYGLPPDDRYDTNTGDVLNVQQGLISNPRAKAVADSFYRSVLGVGAADPGQIYDFESGGLLAVIRNNGVWAQSTSERRPTDNGGEGNDNLTGVGGLRLVSRPVEGKLSIEKKFNIKFIDLVPQNYTETHLTYQNSVVTNSKLLEPGASMFLDYEDIQTFIKDVKGDSSTINANSPTSGGR
jgi:hypothetical protein